MTSTRSPHKITIVAPTCFYYQVELFRELADHPDIDLTVYFCSTEALNSKEVQQMYNTDSGWGIENDLLKGYRFKFLRNFSPFPSYLRSIVGLMNFGIWGEIKRNKPDVVLLMSWMNPVWWIAVLACIVFKVPFLYLTDANVRAESEKAKWKIWGKKMLLGKILFHQTSGALYAGTANKLLYSFYGIPEEKLYPFAYSWGYGNYLKISDELRSQRQLNRKEIGIPDDQSVMLFCGRLSPEKGLLNLIEAYRRVGSSKTALVIVGGGDQRATLENLVAEYQLESVYFSGFQDRNNVLKYYAMADLLVMPSFRETWGIAVNEALCFALPAIVSEEVGAGVDLVLPEENGYSFPAAVTDELANRMQRFLDLSPEEKLRMGERSQELMRQWSGRDLAGNLVEYLNSMNGFIADSGQVQSVTKTRPHP